MAVFNVTKERFGEIMGQAQKCAAWSVCLMMARDLGDEDAENNYADKIVERVLSGIPIKEITPERRLREKERILITY
jgi:hypothetical protein